VLRPEDNDVPSTYVVERTPRTANRCPNAAPAERQAAEAPNRRGEYQTSVPRAARVLPHGPHAQLVPGGVVAVEETNVRMPRNRPQHARATGHAFSGARSVRVVVKQTLQLDEQSGRDDLARGKERYPAARVVEVD